MTDRYERIRQALAMEPASGSWMQGIDEDAAFAMFCCQSAAEAAFITACDPDTIRSLLDERDALAAEVERLAEMLRELETSGAWSRALRLADDAAESAICTVGHNTENRQWVLYPEQIAADPYLEDYIAHLEWRGLAKVVREDVRMIVVFDD